MKNYSHLKAMLAIARASFISMLKSPSSVIFSIAFPLIFIVVFGFISGGRINIDVAVETGCDTLNPLFRDLQGLSTVRLIKASGEEIEKGLQKGSLDASLRIVKNLADQGPVYLVNLRTSGASLDKAGLFKLVLSQAIDRRVIENANILNPFAEVQETRIEGREFKMIDFILPGQLGFSILSAGVFGTAFVFISLRQTLVIKRFFATPVRKSDIVLGEALSRLLFAMIGSLIIILIGHFAFGFTLIHGAATLAGMLMLSALGLIVFMGFGFVVSGIARNESAVPPIANIVTLPQFLLSGTFFPISNFPSWLQPVCQVLPLTYLNDAMRKVAFEGAGVAEISTQLLVLTLWGVVIYGAAVRVFRWE
jgi:ABC-2 type transport system permease protein